MCTPCYRWVLLGRNVPPPPRTGNAGSIAFGLTKSYSNSRDVFTSDDDCRLDVFEQITGAKKGERDEIRDKDKLHRFSRQHPPSWEDGGGFRAKEEAMRAASAENWADNELFSIKNAFDLQFKRLEVIN